MNQQGYSGYDGSINRQPGYEQNPNSRKILRKQFLSRVSCILPVTYLCLISEYLAQEFGHDGMLNQNSSIVPGSSSATVPPGSSHSFLFSLITGSARTMLPALFCTLFLPISILENKLLVLSLGYRNMF